MRQSKHTKIDFFSVDDKGNFKYEFSSGIVLAKQKPLTKIIRAKSNEIGVPEKMIAVNGHRRNNIHYKQPINLKNHLGVSIFKQPNVVRFYCIIGQKAD